MYCKCVETLNREEKNSEVLRVINHAIVLKFDTSKLIILSDLDKTRCISINTVKYNIYKGINFICLCRIARITENVTLKLATDYLLELVRIEQFERHSEVFKLKHTKHREGCKFTKVSTLQTLCQQQIFVQGIHDRKYLSLVKKGTLPKDLFLNRPKRYNHLNHFTFTDIFQIYCTNNEATILSCSKPMSHLGPNAVHNI